MDCSVSKIRQGLSNLPQELYDQIYTEVFTATPSQVRKLDQSLRALLLPVKLMQISQTTRELYTTSFYSTSFEFSGELETMLRWLASVPELHRSLIHKVTYFGKPGQIDSAWHKWEAFGIYRGPRRTTPIEETDPGRY
jgi:hypothetical protein